MMTIKSFNHSKFYIKENLYYRVYAIFLTLILIYMSEYVSFRDQGDFARAVGGMLKFPDGGIGNISQMRWEFLDEGFFPIEKFNLSAYIFRGLGYFIRIFSREFNLSLVSIPSKILAAWGIAFLASKISNVFFRRDCARALIFIITMVAFFQAHNIGMVKSFYSETILFILLPYMLAGMIEWQNRGSKYLLFFCATAIGLAKTQYFYVPALLTCCIFFIRQDSSIRAHRGFIIAMLASQCTCLIPTLNSPYSQINYYQSTYFGSYMVQTSDQLNKLGLTLQQQACVGIDAWGVRADGPGGSRPYRKGISCYGKEHQSLRDVLAPYLADPFTLWRLAVYALPEHFTVGYFHVFRDYFYVAPTNSTYGPGVVLMKLTAWRERTVTKVALILIVLGLALSCRNFRSRTFFLSPPMAFLSLFIVSQVFISLFGEGIRDLSKHLWGAQLALDILFITLIFKFLASSLVQGFALQFEVLILRRDTRITNQHGTSRRHSSLGSSPRSTSKKNNCRRHCAAKNAEAPGLQA